MRTWQQAWPRPVDRTSNKKPLSAACQRVRVQMRNCACSLSSALLLLLWLGTSFLAKIRAPQPPVGPHSIFYQLCEVKQGKWINFLTKKFEWIVISLGYGLWWTNHLVVTFWEPLLLGKSIQVVLFGSKVCLKSIITFLLQSGTRSLFFLAKRRNTTFAQLTPKFLITLWEPKMFVSQCWKPTPYFLSALSMVAPSLRVKHPFFYRDGYIKTLPKEQRTDGIENLNSFNNIISIYFQLRILEAWPLTCLTRPYLFTRYITRTVNEVKKRTLPMGWGGRGGRWAKISYLWNIASWWDGAHRVRRS